MSWKIWKVLKRTPKPRQRYDVGRRTITVSFDGYEEDHKVTLSGHMILVHGRFHVPEDVECLVGRFLHSTGPIRVQRSENGAERWIPRHRVVSIIVGPRESFIIER